MQNCSRSIENSVLNKILGSSAAWTPTGGSALDPRYRLALPRSPCVYYFKKILRIGPDAERKLITGVWGEVQGQSPWSWGLWGVDESFETFVVFCTLKA